MSKQGTTVKLQQGTEHNLQLGTEQQAATGHRAQSDRLQQGTCDYLYLYKMHEPVKRAPGKFALVTRKRTRLDSLALSLDAAPC